MAAFNGAGADFGVETWRIEKMEPARCDPKDFGKLYSGDCYILLHTYEKFTKKCYDLFFWLGKDCSQDERGAAALHTINLDDMLGGEPVQYREVQGHESAKFKAIFKDGIQYLEGGIDSGFNHVDPEAYEPRLFQVKGKRSASARQVELNHTSLNSGDVFILDLGVKGLYQWNGSGANRYEKAAALSMVTRIKNDERGGKVDIVVMEEGKDDNAAVFWQHLGTDGSKPGSIKSAEEGGSDDEHKAAPPKLFQASDASGSLEIKQVGEGKLTRDMLDSNDAFILDGAGSVFVWIGKGATKQERQNAMKFGTGYLDQAGLPDWTPVVRVPESGEPPQFKALFSPWDPPKVFDFSSGPVEQKELEINASAMTERRKKAEEKMADDGSGEVKIWRIEDFDKKEIPQDQYGQFFAGDSYIVLYTYQNNGKPAWIIYFWQGNDSSTDEKGASALLAKQLDDDLGGDPVQVRVVQNKEPNHFYQLFKGKMIVHSGGRASAFKNRADTDSYDVDGVSLYHVRGTNEFNTRAVAVEEKAGSLNSGDCFVLLTPENMYVWYGVGANADERSTAMNVANILKHSRNLVEVEEGSEPEEFWAAIGGQGEYAHSKSIENSDFEPRLFQASTVTGKLIVDEIFDYSQEDLIPEDVMILDAHDEVFVWVGNGATKEEKEQSLKIALDYIKDCGDGRSADTPVFKVHPGFEPPNFTCHFLGWDSSRAAAHRDPYQEQLARSGATVGGTTRVTADNIGGPDPSKTKFSYEQLKNNDPAIGDIDKKTKEKYLSDDDFQTVFKMSRSEFEAKPKWKQDQEKKKVGLF